MSGKTIIQAPHVSIAAIKAIAGDPAVKALAEVHEGPLTIQISMGNFNASISEGQKEQPIDVTARALPMEDEALLAYIETFPEPRLKNFVDHIFSIVHKKFGTYDEVKDFLGVSYRTAVNKLYYDRFLPLEAGPEKEEFLDALEKSNGNVREASRMLGISYEVAQDRVKRWRLRDLLGHRRGNE